jgi:hypothetical protein
MKGMKLCALVNSEKPGSHLAWEPGSFSEFRSEDDSGLRLYLLLDLDY